MGIFDVLHGGCGHKKKWVRTNEKWITEDRYCNNMYYDQRLYEFIRCLDCCASRWRPREFSNYYNKSYYKWRRLDRDGNVVTKATSQDRLNGSNF